MDEVSEHLLRHVLIFHNHSNSVFCFHFKSKIGAKNPFLFDFTKVKQKNELCKKSKENFYF